MLKSLRKERRPRDLLLVFELFCIALLYLFPRESQEGFDRSIIYLAVGLITIIYVSNFALGKITTGDNYLFLIVSMLLSIGVVMTFRIEPSVGIRQLVWALTGILLFYLTYFVVKYFPRLERFVNLYVLVAVILFIATLLFGSAQYGAKNWITLGGGVAFQPTEITKILLMFILASFYTRYEKYTTFRYPAMILMGLVYFFTMLLFLQPDLGTAVIFVALFTVVQFVYERDRRFVLLNIGLLCLGAILGFFLFSHVRVRVAIWRDPFADAYGKGRQIVQSLFAIAEGGFFGTGIGFGFPKLIPVSVSDFIFPVICEEMGIFMGIGIIMLYLLLVYRGIKIALEQEYIFYRILALCASVLFAIQAFLNIGGAIKLIPMTGLTLPFISYGGSSMLSSFMTLAILQVTSEDLSMKYEKE